MCWWSWRGDTANGRKKTKINATLTLTIRLYNPINITYVPHTKVP
jgi:hypothetical protein